MRNLHSDVPMMAWLHTLVAFEATARHGSVKQAADELSLTPGAVSRQIKHLEESINAVLFQRGHNSIELTEVGRVFLAKAHVALAAVRTGVQEVYGLATRLTVKVPFTLMQRWLIPRLGEFRKAHPATDLRLRTMPPPAGDQTDIEIVYLRGEPRADVELGVLFLLDRTVPICRADLIPASAAPLAPERLLAYPILQDTPDGWSWHQWCRQQGIAYQPQKNVLIFDTDEASIDACLAGLGIAQANMAFISPILARDDLAMPCGARGAILGGYYAVIRNANPAADVFVDWLKTAGLEAGS
ncbi:MAG: LysR substrate-binding domain-containing protein [Pseudomonadota bacterium]